MVVVGLISNPIESRQFKMAAKPEVKRPLSSISPFWFDQSASQPVDSGTQGQIMLFRSHLVYMRSLLASGGTSVIRAWNHEGKTFLSSLKKSQEVTTERYSKLLVGKHDDGKWRGNQPTPICIAKMQKAPEMGNVGWNASLNDIQCFEVSGWAYRKATFKTT